MIFIPAIDIINGRCVRLTQGDYTQIREYAENPVDMALALRDQGAEFLHVIDLDAAKEGGAGNIEIIKQIIGAVDIPVQVGGGVRATERAHALIEVGAERVILGTVIVKSPLSVGRMIEKFGKKLVAGIDAREGIVRISGWREGAGIGAVELGRQVREMGFSLIIYTDIASDGMLSGPNIPEIERMARVTGLPVIAAGGIKDIEDIRKLLRLEAHGVVGAISGRAICEGTLDLREAMRVARGLAL
jgi:phosphoribosylformimino-5-aminoimidazole carboxamide ribotide isomerase